MSYIETAEVPVEVVANQTPSAIVESKSSGVSTRSSVSAESTGRAVEARMTEETRKEKESLAKASMAD